MSARRGMLAAAALAALAGSESVGMGRGHSYPRGQSPSAQLNRAERAKRRDVAMAKAEAKRARKAEQRAHVVANETYRAQRTEWFAAVRP